MTVIYNTTKINNIPNTAVKIATAKIATAKIATAKTDDVKIAAVKTDDDNLRPCEIKDAIYNNDPIEEKLNVIAVISNPCLYARRYKLFNEFIKRMEEDEHVNLFIVELVYNDQSFVITNKSNKNHLQLKTDDPLWHKENMINLGVQHLLPKNYKAFAWIDGDIEFDNNSWALDTLKILNGCKDVVQLFSHCVDLNHDNTNLNIFNGIGYCYNKGHKYVTKGSDYWHPGYAWAITRKAYERIGGLYDKGVLGSGDSIMALSFVNRSKCMNNINYNKDYNNSMLDYQVIAKKIRLGYTPGIIRHFFHGSKQNRRYTDRWKILMKHNYSPQKDLTYNDKGVLIFTATTSNDFKQDILNYFHERKEDDDY